MLKGPEENQMENEMETTVCETAIYGLGLKDLPNNGESHGKEKWKVERKQQM